MWRDLGTGELMVADYKATSKDADDAWVAPVLLEIRDTLTAPQPPEPGGDCEYCVFAEKATKA